MSRFSPQAGAVLKVTEKQVSSPTLAQNTAGWSLGHVHIPGGGHPGPCRTEDLRKPPHLSPRGLDVADGAEGACSWAGEPQDGRDGGQE